MSLYEYLGVSTVVNAAGHYTVLGGSVPSAGVQAAMAEALSSYVDLPEWQKAVHRRLAALTGAECAYVTAGAAAALYLVAIGALRGRSGSHGAGYQVVAFGSNPFDEAIAQAGVGLVRVESLADIGTQLSLGADRTLFVLFSPTRSAGLELLPAVIDTAGRSGTSVVVDAAAQIPPVRNLQLLPSTGVSASIFSGGKGLFGPQTSGLILGDAQYVGSLEEWGFPRLGAGRPFKVGRETLAGLLTAVEEALARDDDAFCAWAEEQVSILQRLLDDHSILQVSRGYPNVAGQPIPFALVTTRQEGCSVGGVIAALRANKPRIEVGYLPDGADMPASGFIINPLTLRDGDVQRIAEALRDLPVDLDLGPMTTPSSQPHRV